MTKNNFRNILGIHYGTSGWQEKFSSTPTSLISCRYVEKQSYTILNFFVSLKKLPLTTNEAMLFLRCLLLPGVMKNSA